MTETFQETQETCKNSQAEFPVRLSLNSLVSSNCDSEVLSSNYGHHSKSNINIEHSQDVVIGPVTRFHGPVTIYQNLPRNSEVQNTSCYLEVEGYHRCRGDSNKEEGVFPGNGVLHENTYYDNEAKIVTPPTSANLPQDQTQEKQQNFVRKLCENLNKNRCLCLTIFVIIFLVTLCVTTTIFVVDNDLVTDENDIYRGNNSENNDTSTSGVKIISRGEWGARLPSSEETLQTPVFMVVIAHSAGKFCNSLMECSIKVRDIQADHMGDNFPDIGYNFLIGGDGNIYEGTGWNIKSNHHNFVFLCFLGNFVFDELTNNMITAAQYIFKRGLANGLLDSEYKLLAHNQTMATLSPGKNVYKIIKTWNHFDHLKYTPERVHLTKEVF